MSRIATPAPDVSAGAERRPQFIAFLSAAAALILGACASTSGNGPPQMDDRERASQLLQQLNDARQRGAVDPRMNWTLDDWRIYAESMRGQ